MNATSRVLILQRWNVIQHELLPELRNDVGALTLKLEKVIHILEWVWIEEFISASWCGAGCPPHERSWLANAFVAKAGLGLIERLTIDRALRRICGFPLCKKWPCDATFSRAFAEFAEGRLAERVHEALIKEHLGDELIGHISRDGTAIIARECPARAAAEATAPVIQAHSIPMEERVVATRTPTTPAAAKKQGRPRRGEVWPPTKESPIARQRLATLAQMIGEIPRTCDRGTKCNAQDYKVSCCILTRPTVVCLSPRCCPRPRCTTAWWLFRSR